jgi:hypothetical protein
MTLDRVWRWGATLLSVLLVASCEGEAPQEPLPDGDWDLIVLAGQSNMVGTGWTGAYVPPDLGDRAFALQGGEWIPAATAEPLIHFAEERRGVGPAPAFAERVIAARPGRKIGLIPCASSATTIRQWQWSAAENSLYGACLREIRLAEASTGSRVRGILFEQGESDGMSDSKDASRWASLFGKYVSAMRADLRDRDLPVVFAQIGDYWFLGDPAPPNWSVVQQQQASVRIRGVRMITTSGLPLFDGLHFTSEAVVEVGHRFGEAWLAIVGSGG